MKLLKWFFGALLVLVLIVVSAGVFLLPKIKEAMDNRGGDSGPSVQVLPVERGRIVRAVSAPGDIEPRSKVQISARTSAQIVELPFEAGEVVKAGDVVVRLDDKDLIAALDAANARMRGDEARYQGANASYVNASIEWERVSKLFETRDIAETEVDDAEAALRRAEADLAAAEHAIESARADVARAEEALKYTTIRSPIDGHRDPVLEVEEGETVDRGHHQHHGFTVMMVIADPLRDARPSVRVDEADIAQHRRDRPGGAHIFAAAYPDDGPVEGTVRRRHRSRSPARRPTGPSSTTPRSSSSLAQDRCLDELSATVDIEDPARHERAGSIVYTQTTDG